ncbi:hypothetical protein ED312_20290 [Sinomicrobium pectinilyticum]|uniref:Uncharacterized protein n=1 Tax=Sinomicrobium pectinilyticum TaxID=1084421 RepID=A0A3N0DQM9_SINP1|nr:hypothetical protein [Sinomicrobium pectinilyticum]RNL77932.1 hypothetical protein ED312_20290 [Sinomicrobium pectinilyticum]
MKTPEVFDVREMNISELKGTHGGLIPCSLIPPLNLGADINLGTMFGLVPADYVIEVNLGVDLCSD